MGKPFVDFIASEMSVHSSWTRLMTFQRIIRGELQAQVCVLEQREIDTVSDVIEVCNKYTEEQTHLHDLLLPLWLLFTLLPIQANFTF